MDTNYSLADIAAATGGNRSNDGFGDGNGWWLILFLLICGWGGYGFGGGFGGYGGGGFNSPAGQGFATRSDIDAALSTQGIESGIQNISTQLCNGFNTLGSQMASCCCDLKQGQGEINYNMAAQTNILQNTVNNGFRDVIENQTAGVQRIIDTITQDKLQSLQTELQSAQLQLSNAAQTNNIINALRPTAIPAYLTCSPYQAMMGYSNCGCNTSCGCGC
ncbi:MAG TPA: hypothetical protein H9955_02795 [Candidatus Mediterraneibacter cottocaccae]|nr:hypothetical protein [Candidatus Mediterraneibacter cottocaccae]